MCEDENPRKGTIMTEAKTHTLDAPGAVLHYDVRSNDASTQPVLLLIGSPMGAEGFVTQAGHFTDRTVVTYDPRGAGRSKRTDGASETTVDEHADDLHRLTATLGAGPVDIFASSGIGAESAGVMPGRTAAAVAERLETTPVTFPGGHGGFARNEYERTNDPGAFAATLGKVLTD